MDTEIKWRAPRSVLKGLREARVHFGLFDFAVFCIVGPHGDIQRYVEWRHGECEPPPEAHGLHYEGPIDRAPIIWIPRIPKSPADYGTLAHEICHVVREMVVDWARMTHDKGNDEVFCHAVSYAMETLLTELKRP